MNIYDVIWKDKFVDKLASKHGVSTEEVETPCLARLTFGALLKGKSKAKMFMPLTAKLTAADT